MKEEVFGLLHEGTVIPAHPLALDSRLKLDEARQRGLTRYYMEAGAGGIAVGVHTTQFEIRNPGIGLLEPVLRLAAEEVDQAALNRPFIKVAGICGPVEQAIKEAELAKRHGYHFGLLSPGGLAAYSENELLERAKAVSEVLPVFGFYLQPAVGGRVLSYDFWLAFSEIPKVHAIKVAAFNRYQTLDVVRAVCESSRKDQIALYTGNDDNIVADLLTPYQFMVSGRQVTKRFVGGLLGHWAVWTGKAVELLKEIKTCIGQGYAGTERLLAKGIAVTDINAVVFDAKNNFKGCIPGIHEILRRQGLLEGVHCLNPEETLSPGQGEEIERIIRMYPDFRD
ncbi:MAG TPA: hypothetical protein PKM27_01585 [Saprospiraceae bacterium]|nr:hypothetical protein [Saprospiraceae bacterium]HNT21540.1 hypothetical protein [Saprospiraceae bacterium]